MPTQRQYSQDEVTSLLRAERVRTLKAMDRLEESARAEERERIRKMCEEMIDDITKKNRPTERIVRNALSDLRDKLSNE